jgi:hypothetical protein
MRRRFLAVAFLIAGCEGSSCEGPPPLRTLTPATPTTTTSAAPPTATLTPPGTPMPTATSSATASATIVLTPSPTVSSPSPSPTPSPTAKPALTAILDYLVERGVLNVVTADGYMEQYQTDPTGDHEHATGDAPGFTPGFIDIQGHAGFLIDLDQEEADALTEALPCVGNVPLGVSVRCGSDRVIQPGRWVMVKAVHDGTFDRGSSDNLLLVNAVVTDPDGDATNNFQPQAGFPGDSFQNSSRWYELYQQGFQMAFVVTNIPPNGRVNRNNSNTDGRVLVIDDPAADQREIGFFIPASEFGMTYRLVSIGAQNNNYSPETSGHDFTAQLDELLPLLPCGGTCTDFPQ